MVEIKFSSRLKYLCPKLTLGTLTADVRVISQVPLLWQEIYALSERVKSELTLDKLSQIQRIKDARELYRSLGKDPTRYRLSAEALFRRLLKGQSLYQVNNIVDINNLLSIVTYFSLGTYDLDKISGEIIFQIGKTGEEYIGIGRGLINLDKLPVFTDDLGHFGSPTSDSKRSMVTEKTKKILLNMISFSGEDGLAENLLLAQRLLKKYAEAVNVQLSVFS